jgi:hypothetical protein
LLAPVPRLALARVRRLTPALLEDAFHRLAVIGAVGGYRLALRSLFRSLATGPLPTWLLPARRLFAGALSTRLLPTGLRLAIVLLASLPAGLSLLGALLPITWLPIRLLPGTLLFRTGLTGSLPVGGLSFAA